MLYSHSAVSMCKMWLALLPALLSQWLAGEFFSWRATTSCISEKWKDKNMPNNSNSSSSGEWLSQWCQMLLQEETICTSWADNASARRLSTSLRPLLTAPCWKAPSGCRAIWSWECHLLYKWRSTMWLKNILLKRLTSILCIWNKSAMAQWQYMSLLPTMQSMAGAVGRHGMRNEGKTGWICRWWPTDWTLS